MSKSNTYTKEEKEKILGDILPTMFKLGYSIRKAAKYAGLPFETIRDWIRNDKAYRSKVHTWQHEMDILARRRWREAMEQGIETKHGTDTFTASKEWAIRREKDELSTRTEQTGADGEAIQVVINKNP